jgi:hypothetical protein
MKEAATTYRSGVGIEQDDLSQFGSGLLILARQGIGSGQYLMGKVGIEIIVDCSMFVVDCLRSAAPITNAA